MASGRKQFLREDLFINRKSDQVDYQPNVQKKILGYSWGQRKLLMGKIEALSMYWDPIKTPEILIVYAGASPFTYSEILYELFGKIPGTRVEWHLYDPREIKLAENTQNMTVFREYFTDETAKKYANEKNVFFFSDIRTVDSIGITKATYEKYKIILDARMKPISGSDRSIVARAKNESSMDIENGILQDMLMQQRWVLIMNPVHAFLKMRLPYIYDISPEEHQNVTYLAGEILLQPWVKAKSTETRLHPVRNTEGNYYTDNWISKEYESLLAQHNTNIRPSARYFNPLNPTSITDVDIDPPELYCDWDSCAEATILKMYCEKMNVAPENIRDVVVQLSRTITSMLNVKNGTEKTLSRVRELSDKENHRNLFRPK